MASAIKANELGALGDRFIGTTPPLRFRLLADPQKSSVVGSDSIANFTIGSVHIFCGENEILDPVEREIAWTFMLHGKWEASSPEAELNGNKLVAVEIRWEPTERQNIGFEMIGTLSEIFSRYYAEVTVQESEVVQVLAPMRPGWFEPLVSPDYNSKELPLWRIIQQPNYDVEAEE